MVAVNTVVAAILRSPLHPLLSHSVDLVRFTGRQSGRTITTPTQYARLGDDVVILVGHPWTKRWWRNFRQEHAIDVLVRGRWLHMAGRAVVGADEPDVIAPLVEAYVARFPKVAPAVGDSPVIVWCRPR